MPQAKRQTDVPALSQRISLTLTGWAYQLAGYWAALPALAQVLAIYAASRLWGLLIFSRVGQQQTTSPWQASGPMTYLDFVTIWDADWYRQIALTGYPSTLPLDSWGNVAQNPWAFYPLYPWVSSLLMQASGLDYRVIAPSLSLAAGFGAAWLIYRLFASSLARQSAQKAHSLALWGLALVAFNPVAPILQTGYAEALGLLFLTWALLYLVQGRYWLLLLPALAAALTRPVGVPLGATVGLYWLACWVGQARAGKNPLLALKDTAGQLSSALAVCGFAFVHPAAAWLTTGRLDAYTATEAAWRAGGEEVLPFIPWITQSQLYLGQLLGPILLVLLLLVVTLFLLSPLLWRTLHPALILWAAAYLLYMLIFFNPQSSTFRLLLPLFPLALPLVALSASRAYRLALVLTAAGAQWGWVGWLWHWKQLPGGGDYPP